MCDDGLKQKQNCKEHQKVQSHMVREPLYPEMEWQLHREFIEIREDGSKAKS